MDGWTWKQWEIERQHLNSAKRKKSVDIFPNEDMILSSSNLYPFQVISTIYRSSLSYQSINDLRWSQSQTIQNIVVKKTLSPILYRQNYQVKHIQTKKYRKIIINHANVQNMGNFAGFDYFDVGNLCFIPKFIKMWRDKLSKFIWIQTLQTLPLWRL